MAFGDLTFVRASTKYVVGSNGLIQEVAVNVPAFEFNADGSYNGLLLEPQRTNLVTFSEQFDNAAWIKTATTITANNAVSPDGNTNADLLLETAATSNHPVLSDLFSLVSGTTYTFSVFAKNISGGRGLLQVGGYQIAGSFQDAFANFNLTTEVVTQQTQGTGKIENYGNGWYRCSLTFACTNTVSERLNVTLIDSGTAGFNPSYAGDVSKGLLIWGAQAEAGSYVSSYIPTLGSSVTRLADAASATGISSLIGQTEGTLFLDFEGGANDSIDYVYGINDGTTNNRIIIYRSNTNRIITQVRVGGGSQAIMQTATVTANTRQKCAVAYKLNDVAFYVNGVQIGLDTSATIPTCSVLATSDGAGAGLFGRSINQAALFTTRLTNAQLAELTTL
jgi:hypothetical protein